MSNQFVVKHKVEGTVVEFIYDFEGDINFFEFSSNDEVQIIDFENNEKIYTIKKYKDLEKIKELSLDDESLKELSQYIKEKDLTTEDKKI